MLLVKRIAAASAGLALSLGGLVALAPAASASPQSCFFYVLENHPGADLAVVEEACKVGAAGGTEARHACYKLMRDAYIPAKVALDACRRAPE